MSMNLQAIELRAPAAPIDAPPVSSHAAEHTTKKKHIRGSFLLLVGRLVSLGLNFGSQVLIVRYLTKEDYGSFAYALSFVSLGAAFSAFGLDKAVSRFAPMYHEQRNFSSLFGTLILTIGTSIGLGLTLVLALYGMHGLLNHFVSNEQSIALLLILILLAPVEAMDRLLGGLIASFASPRAIFVRRHVVGPGLKLAAILGVMFTGSSVYVLAGGFLIAGFLGASLYGVLLWRVLRRDGILSEFSWRQTQFPARELYSFSVPLFSSELVLLLRGAVVVFLLGYFQVLSVAEFRSVLPVAGLNKVVAESFQFLFMPLAARLLARNDNTGIGDLYRRTAAWIAVLTFPVFAASFCMARPVTVLLFGSRYADSATILAILSLGYFVDAALGFNALTLKVYGKVRYILALDAIAAVTAVVANLLLIPHYGALGGAIATASTLMLHNVLNQLALRYLTGIHLMQRRYIILYISIMASVGVLLVIQLCTTMPLYIGAVLVVATSLAILWINQPLLEIETMFPELLNTPVLRSLFGPGRTS